MMIDNEVSFTSLCYITVDYEGRIWLNRLAYACSGICFGSTADRY